MKLLIVMLILSVGPRIADADAPPSGVVVEIDSLPGFRVAAGETRRVSLPIRIAAGFHVQANPASNEFLVPLELQLNRDDSDSLVSLRTLYPEPDKLRLRGASEDLLTYHGGIELTLEIDIHPDAPLGPRSWSGQLRYQACDDRRCLFPTSAVFTLEFVVSAPGEENGR